MVLFYIPDVKLSKAVLSDEEFYHCIKVLRKRRNDSILFTDGNSSLFHGRIVSIDKTIAELMVEKHFKYKSKPPYFHVAISPTKNLSRFEWFLEKATELGVSEITPLLCARSERTKIKELRARKILISAMKQSNRYQLPKLNPACEYADFISMVNSHPHKFIANYKKENSFFSSHIKVDHPAIVMIGPEGDFTEKELSIANTNGVNSVNLGSFRLRTETAGVVSCSQFFEKQKHWLGELKLVND